jgi:hypothetical protein
MTLNEIMWEMGKLSTEDLEKLHTLLKIEEDLRDPEFRAKLIRKINDNDPSHWVTLEEAERILLG